MLTITKKALNKSGELNPFNFLLIVSMDKVNDLNKILITEH